jgi:hypothetical protein
MSWQAYRVVLRLRSPLHIGHSKVGNLQRTRPYVTGRGLWGALTMRMTRDAYQGRGPATDSQQYHQFGEQVHILLAFTYFYPALKSNTYDGYSVQWPWENESAFRRRFLSSHAGTALSYPAQSATEGTLHEVEFISPRTLDTGEPVFLTGYVFEKEGCTLTWRAAFQRLQLGGERGYGWGDVELVGIQVANDKHLFAGSATFDGEGDQMGIYLPKGGRLLAHVVATGLPVAGDVEPLVGREWQSNHPRNRYAGQHVGFSDVCFAPGSIACENLNFMVSRLGVWRASSERSGGNPSE